MVPDIDLRLQVCSNAMRNIAAQPGDGGSLSSEQLQLSAATLDQVRSLLPFNQIIARRELAIALRMAERIAEAASGGDLQAEITSASTISEQAEATPVELNEARASLLSAVSTLIDKSQADLSYRQIARIALEHDRAALDIARACCLPAGFETNPDEVVRLKDLREELLEEAP